MRTYKVSRGTEYLATVCVQDDGQKDWTFAPEWTDFWLDANDQEAIEQAIGHAPNETVMVYEDKGYTIRQCSV